MKAYALALRIAIFSDVHANLPALEATLEGIHAAGVDARYALGDLVGYAPWPNDVLERLSAEGFPIVMGNWRPEPGLSAPQGTWRDEHHRRQRGSRVRPLEGPR